jgi:FAD synthetase
MSELSEDPAERTRKYIISLEKGLQELTPKKTDSVVETLSITRISDTIERYLKDAHYYLEHGKPSTSLASIAYAEGLLDALRFLDLVESKTVQ